jgi:hypothetical protein
VERQGSKQIRFQFWGVSARLKVNAKALRQHTVQIPFPAQPAQCGWPHWAGRVERKEAVWEGCSGASTLNWVFKNDRLSLWERGPLEKHLQMRRNPRELWRFKELTKAEKKSSLGLVWLTAHPILFPEGKKGPVKSSDVIRY